MKKLLLLLTLMIGALTAHASDYSYLTFETTDGAKVSVNVSSLTIKISGTTLTAGDQSFTLSNLSKMYFSTSDQTTGIKTIQDSRFAAKGAEYYDLQGRKITKTQAQRQRVYIMKTKSGTHKIIVK